MGAKRSKTSITVDPELWHQFLIKLAVDKKKSTDALDEALEGWITGRYTPRTESRDEAKSVAAYPRYRQWHEYLDVILDSQTKHAADAIQKNLEMFAFSTTVAGPKSPDDIRLVLDSLRKGKELTRKGAKHPKKNSSDRAS